MSGGDDCQSSRISDLDDAIDAVLADPTSVVNVKRRGRDVAVLLNRRTYERLERQTAAKTAAAGD